MSEIPPDELLARLLEEDHEIEERLEHFHTIGRVVAAVYTGLTRNGVPADDALELTRDWMECHIFDRVARYTGTFESPEDADEDATEESETE